MEVLVSVIVIEGVLTFPVDVNLETQEVPNSATSTYVHPKIYLWVIN